MRSGKKSSAAAKLSHVDERGNARMVDVGEKPVSRRVAVATGHITVQPATLSAIASGQVPKGDVLACARIAAIQAAKRCDQLIPLCHSLPLDAVEISFELPTPKPKARNEATIVIRATVTVQARTGVEMEALTAVTIAALTIYDMCKAIDKSMKIGNIELISKTKSPLR